jgi:hypothetical protein
VQGVARIHACDSKCAIGERIAALLLSDTVDGLVDVASKLGDEGLRSTSDMLKEAQKVLEARKQLVLAAEIRLLECALQTERHREN